MDGITDLIAYAQDDLERANLGRRVEALSHLRQAQSRIAEAIAELEEANERIIFLRQRIKEMCEDSHCEVRTVGLAIQSLTGEDYRPATVKAVIDAFEDNLSQFRKEML